MKVRRPSSEHDVDPVTERVAGLLARSGRPGPSRGAPTGRAAVAEGGRAGEAAVARSMLVPNVGAPPGWIGSPCLSRMSAKPEPTPSATATPGTSRTASTMLLVQRADLSAGGGDVRVVGGSGTCTTTSVPEVRPAYSSSKALTIVSESTKVPDTKVTPTVTAATVRSRRSLLTSRLRSETRSIAQPPSRPMISRTPLPGRVGELARRSAPSARNTTRSAYAAAPGSWVTITTVWPRSSTTERRNRSSSVLALRVQRPGRLVGEDDLRTGDQRPCHGDALLLAPGELRGPVAQPVAEVELVDHGVQPRPVGRAPGEVGRAG